MKDKSNQHPRPLQKKAKIPAEDVEALKAELKVLREEISKEDDHQDKFLRLQAEFDNFKKRNMRERQEFIKFANESLILELVGILDDFERSIKYAQQKEDFRLLHQGVDMISRQLHQMLKEKGLEKIACVNEKFNPHQHEALEVTEDVDVDDDTVVEELQPGYTLNGRVIRPAKVKVVKRKEKEEEKTEDK